MLILPHITPYSLFFRLISTTVGRTAQYHLNRYHKEQTKKNSCHKSPKHCLLQHLGNNKEHTVAAEVQNVLPTPVTNRKSQNKA
jgi:hypothetical protein